MARVFQHGDTVICLGRIINTFTGVLANPATSIKIDIYNPNGTLVVTAQDMSLDDPVLTLDGVSYNYHYDYNPDANAIMGEYKYIYYAVDGTRKVEHGGSFILE